MKIIINSYTYNIHNIENININEHSFSDKYHDLSKDDRYSANRADNNDSVITDLKNRIMENALQLEKILSKRGD